MPGPNDPYDLSSLLAVTGGLGEQEQALQAQLAAAQKLRDRVAPRQQNHPGAALGGLIANIVGNYRAGTWEEQAARGQADVSARRKQAMTMLPGLELPPGAEGAPEQQRALSRTLAGSGDPTLGAVGAGYDKAAAAQEAEAKWRGQGENMLTRTAMQTMSAEQIAALKAGSAEFKPLTGDANHSGIILHKNPAGQIIRYEMVGKAKPPPTHFNQGAGNAPMSDEELTLLAHLAARKGPQVLSFLPRNDPNRAGVIKKIVTLYGPDHPLAQNMAESAAESAALTKIEGQTATLRPFENMLGLNGKVLQDYLDKIPDSDINVFNTVSRGLASQMGDPDMAAFKAAINAFSTEAARILNNPNLTGQMADQARKDLEAIHSTSYSKAQLLNVMKVVKMDAENRLGEMSKEAGARRTATGKVTTAPNAPIRALPNATGKANDPLGIR